MTTAWVFPGQGADEPRMGLDLAAHFEPAAALLRLASQSAGRDMFALLARGGPELERSEVLQPVLIAVSLGAALALRARGARPDLVAGHSLGELAAWSSCGAIDASDAVRLAASRGRLMAECSCREGGGMLALAGHTERVVKEAMEHGSRHRRVVIAAHNAPDEWALSGDEPALREIALRVRCVRLRAAGPWHTPWMEPAARQLRSLALQLPVGALTVPLVSCITGQLIDDSSQFARACGDLVERPLQWVTALSTLRSRGVTSIVTCGPGKVMRSLARRVFGTDVTLYSTGNQRELELAVEGSR
jgi:[acyl-carrier-protein] S-malonyltransferase